MGVQSTQNISREDAIERILLIHSLIIRKKYRTLEDNTFEHDYNLEEYVNAYDKSINISDIEEYTDTMIVALMNSPYIRYSMFDNYTIPYEGQNE